MTDVLLVDRPLGQLIVAPVSAAGLAVAEQPVAQLVVTDPAGGVQTLVASAPVATLSLAPAEVSTLVAQQPTAQLLVGDQGSIIYGPNVNGDRAAFILPDLGRPGGFVPDPDGVNINGFNPARLIYQVRLSSEPTETNNSRVGAMFSTIWTARVSTPTKKQSRYSYYFTAKGYGGDIAFPQEFGVVVVKSETPAGELNGKNEAEITVAAHERVLLSDTDEFSWETEDGEVILSEAGDPIVTEDGTEGWVPTAGKLVVKQYVLVNDGEPLPWDHDLTDDDSAAGSLDPDSEGLGGDEPESGGPYPTYAQALNNAGSKPGFAASIAKARKESLGGSKWLHAYYVKKDAAACFSFIHKNQFGVCATGFDPGDGRGVRLMPYMGIGIDAADTPLHLKGPITLEQRFEYVGAVAAGQPYDLAKFSFFGRSDFGTTTSEMAEIGVEVIDPTRGGETSELWLKARWNGSLTDGLRLGQGLYSPLAAGGDPGAGGANFKSVYIDGVLALGVDTMPPATPTGISDPPTQTFRTSPGGTQQAIVTWTWTANTEPDLAGYIVAYRRGTSGPFVTAKVEDPSFSLETSGGETVQIKVAAHDWQHNKSLYTAVSPTAGYVVTGDSTAPAVITVAAAPEARPKAVVMKVTAPSDANVGGLSLYCAVNGGAEALIEFRPCRPGALVRFTDNDAYTSGDSLAYSVATVNLDMVESATRTSLGPAVTFRGSLGPDIEPLAVDAGVHLTGDLPLAQGASLPSGEVSPIGLQTLSYQVADGDTIDFPYPLGQAPPYMVDRGGLPALAVGDSYSLLVNSLTEIGGVAYMKAVTPGTATVHTITTANTLESGMPLYTGGGYSITKGNATDPNNGKLRLSISFQWSSTVAMGTKAVWRVFYQDGGGWVFVGDFDFIVPFPGGSAGYGVQWTLLGLPHLSATAKIGVQWKGGSLGVQFDTPNPLTQLKWTDRTDTVLTPVSGDVLVVFYPLNQG